MDHFTAWCIDERNRLRELLAYIGHFPIKPGAAAGPFADHSGELSHLIQQVVDKLTEIIGETDETPSI